jgi:glycosyltransferase involved in cell wall biosynthesis
VVITLRVVLDPLLAPVPGGIGRYTEELTRQIIATKPPGCAVEGLVASSPQSDYDRISTLLPELDGLHKSVLARRELTASWRYGLTPLGRGGLVHAPSLLAPLGRHDRVEDPGNQTVVTVHDVVPWTHPDTMTPQDVAWHKAMAKRAVRYADAVVVPTHAVAGELSGILGLGDRIRVIGGAVSPKLELPVDADERATRLGLPERYLLTVGTLEPRKGIAPLIESLAHPASVDLPLLIAGPAGWGGLDVARTAADLGIDPERVRALGYLSDADLAVAMSRATVFVFPGIAEGFGLPVIEAFSLGTPVVHSDAPAVVEVSADAGLAVRSSDALGYPGRLAEAIAGVAGSETLSERMALAGLDRARSFSWRDSARQVWQLHADL